MSDEHSNDVTIHGYPAIRKALSKRWGGDYRFPGMPEQLWRDANAELQQAESQNQALQEAANPELALIPSDEEMYRIFTSGTENERIALSTSLRVLVSRIRNALSPTQETDPG